MIYTKEELEKYDLQDEGYVEYVFMKSREAIVHDQVTDALDIADLIDQWYKKNPQAIKDNQALFDDYSHEAVYCQWVALPILDQTRLLNLYNAHVNELRSMISAYELEPTTDFAYYFQEKLRQHLVNIVEYKDRDSLKELIRKNLLANEEVLFNVRLSIGGREEKSTVANWFKYYFGEVGTGELDKLKQSAFFSQNRVFQGLNKKQQETMRTIFNTYERIKISSFKQGGNEDEVDYEDGKTMGTVLYGNLTRYPEKEVKDFDKFIDWWSQETGEDLKAIPVPNPPSGMALRGRVDQVPREPGKIAASRNPQDTPKPKRRVTDVKEDFFTPEQKTEINLLKRKAANKVPNPQPLITAVVADQHLAFPNAEMEQRFNTISTTFLKGIRDNQSFLNAVCRPALNGGLGWQPDQAEKIRFALVQASSDPRYQKLPEKKPLPKKQIPKPTFSQVSGKMKTAASSRLKPIPKMKPVPPPPLPKPLPKPAPKPIPRPASIPKPTPKPAPKPIPRPMPKPTPKPAPKPMPKPIPRKVKASGLAPLPRLKRVATPDKPIVTDVRSPQRLVMGPIDELRAMTLGEFRTLGAHPEDAAENIYDKINVLLHESVTKKAEGIQAWKRSPLNRLYLTIGQKAMDAGKSIEEYLSSKEGQSPQMLNLEEFEAVADLNRKLRF